MVLICRWSCYLVKKEKSEFKMGDISEGTLRKQSLCQGDGRDATASLGFEDIE